VVLGRVSTVVLVMVRLLVWLGEQPRTVGSLQTTKLLRPTAA